MVFQAAELVILGAEAQLLPIHRVEIETQRRSALGAVLKFHPQVIGIENVEGIKQLRVRCGIEALFAEGADVRQMDALAQPNRVGTYRLDRLPRRQPKIHGDGACHVAAEAVHDACPKAERLNLIVPQRMVAVVQIDNIRPVADLVAAAAVGLAVVEFGVLADQRRVG